MPDTSHPPDGGPDLNPVDVSSLSWAVTLGRLQLLGTDGPAADPGTIRIRLAEHVVRVAAAVDPAGVLADLDRHDTIGPHLDPTLYRAAEQGLREVRRLMTALLPAATLYRDVTGELAAQVAETAVQP